MIKIKSILEKIISIILPFSIFFIPEYSILGITTLTSIFIISLFSIEILYTMYKKDFDYLDILILILITLISITLIKNIEYTSFTWLKPWIMIPITIFAFKKLEEKKLFLICLSFAGITFLTINYLTLLLQNYFDIGHFSKLHLDRGIATGLSSGEPKNGMMVCWAFLLSYGLMKVRNKKNISLIIITFVAITSILLTGSRSSLLSLILTLILCFIYFYDVNRNNFKNLFTSTLIPLFILLGGFLILLQFNLHDVVIPKVTITKYLRFFYDGAVIERIDLAINAFSTIKHSLVQFFFFGFGPEFYFKEIGFTAHNGYLDTLISVGVVCSLLIFYLILKGLNLKSFVTGKNINIFSLLVLIILLNSLFHDFFRTKELWIFLGCALSIKNFQALKYDQNLINYKINNTIKITSNFLCNFTQYFYMLGVLLLCSFTFYELLYRYLGHAYKGYGYNFYENINGIQWVNDMHDNYYKNPSIFENWEYGFHYVPNVEFETSAYYYDPKIRSFTEEYRYKFLTNNLGYVHDKLIVQNKKSILIIGDSFTEGRGGYPWVNDLDLNKKNNIQLISAGIQGTGIQSWEKTVQKLKNRFKVEKIVIIFIFDDFFRDIWSFDKKQMECFSNIALCNYKNLHLPKNHTINEVDAISNLSRDTFFIFNKMKSLISSFKTNFYIEDHTNKLSNLRLDSNLKSLETILSQFSSENVLLINLPQYNELSLGLDKATSKLNKKVTKIAKDSNIEYIRISKMCKLEKKDYLYRDKHFNIAGYKKLSKCVNDLINSKWKY